MVDKACNAPLIELSAIRKQYGGQAGEGDGTPAVQVLHGIDLTIRAGEFVAIVGASGSGKSTLMHILGCLDRPSSGTYRFAGRDVAALNADELAALRREAFGFVFQGYHLIPSLDALHNVQMPAVYAGMPAEARQQRAQALLERLGLGERASHRPRQLSGGQQQRASIARALMNGGQVILADEPTGALDSHSGAEVMALLRELSDAGHTVILITHDAQVAAQARRVVRIHDGCIVEDSAASEPGVDQSAAPAAVAAAAREAAESGWAAIYEAMTGAWHTLWASRSRTLLTLLSFIIGVASMIVLVAVSQGSNEQTLARITQYGTHRMTIVPEVDEATGRRGALYEADAQVVEAVPNVRASMISLFGDGMLRTSGHARQLDVWCVSGDIREVLNWKLAQGMFFDRADEQALAPVLVLGKVARERLFPGLPPAQVIGQHVLLNDMPFRVIGEMEEKGDISGSSSEDDVVLIPYATGSQRVFGQRELSMISVLLESLDTMERTERDIRETLAGARRAEDFRIVNSAKRIQAEREQMHEQTLMLALIAGISLLVGGIGVMNIMLMSVKERTREIGIRMATGARQGDIRRQFLSEAAVVSLTGGAAGVVIGLLIGVALIAWGVPVIFSVRAILGAFCCALATGLVFGLMPARQAARLDPVVALAGE